jgi:hypothetical protein
MSFSDSRNAAELLLAPKLPLARSVVNFSSLRLNLGGVTALPGVISDATQLSGPIRTSLGATLANKSAVEGLAGSLTSVLSGYDSQAAALKNGSFVPPDPLLVPASVGVPKVADFFSFSSLAPGAAVPANFARVIQNRKAQLQSLTKTFSSMFSKSGFGGVTLTENTHPTTYPLAADVDLPSGPRLAQGGAAAQNDAILKDKIKFTTKGVNIGSGKPSFWNRLLGAVAAAAPNLNPVVNQLFRDRKNQSTWSEPVTPYAAQFPYNRVQQSASGHVIELDDTPGAERVHVFHRSGSFIEFHPDGSVVYRTMGDGYSITMADHHVKVNGKYHVAVDGGCTVYSKGNIDVQSDGDVNVQAKGDYNVFAQNINLRAKKTFKADGIIMDMRYLTLPMSIVPVFAGFVGPIGFAPRVNMAAIALDYPDANIDAVAAAKPSLNSTAPTLPVNLGPAGGASSLPVPPENPLTNFSVYSQQTPAAVSYRAHLFDTPEETQDFELYTAHTGLQSSLGDTQGTERQLGGSLRTIDTGVVAPDAKPTINYLNYNDFKGKYDYTNDTTLGGTSFALADVADVALHPDVVADTTLTDSIEGTVSDSASQSGTGQTPTDSTGKPLPPTTSRKPDTPPDANPAALV